MATKYVKTGPAGDFEKFGSSDVKEVAPNPPVGVTTLTGLAAMIVGVVVAVLSLFDVVPTDEDVQALGTVVGAVLFVVPYVVTAISRTKQATNLAKIAQGERLAARRPLAEGDTVSRQNLTMTIGEPIGRWDEVEPSELGAPVDLSLEVPGGGPKPDDDPTDAQITNDEILKARMSAFDLKAQRDEIARGDG